MAHSLGLLKSSFQLTRVVIRNYKSIATADIHLGSITFMVGPNGSGKSNTLDALRFTADALSGPLDHALQERGGIGDVRRRSTGHPNHFGIRLEFILPSGRTGFYAFRIGARPLGAFEVQTEQCHLYTSGFPQKEEFFEIEKGHVRSSLANAPSQSPDRLYLVNASGFPEFREVFDQLSQLRFYNLNPTAIRELQKPSAVNVLNRDGSNITAVIVHLRQYFPLVKAHIEEYLVKIVPGIGGVDVQNLGPVQTLEFKQDVSGSAHPWKFLASNMSDGTLRALGILVALFQKTNDAALAIPLIGLEEPEVALHPAAMRLIFESILEGAEDRQVIVTSHSTDLLDDTSLPTDAIRAVVSRQGATTVAVVNAAARMTLRDRLYSAGELLRLNQLSPDDSAILEQDRQIDLFSQFV